MTANTLTPQLNASQLKANIDALQKGGMKTADIQSYVNNYKADGKGGYVLASAQPAQPTAPAQPNLASDIAGDTNAHAANITEDFSEKPSLTGALDVAGNVAGEVGDFFGEPLKSAASLLPDAVKQGATSAVKAITGTPEAKAVIDSWNKLQAQHPDAAKSIGNVVNIAALMGGGGADAAAEDAVKPAIQDTAKSLADNAGVQSERAATESAANATDKASQATWEVIKPNLSPTEQAQAVTEGRIASKGMLGTVTQIPKGREIQMIQAATPYVADAKSPIEAVANMQKGISDEATQLKQGIDKTGAIYSKSQVAGALGKIEPPTMIASDATLNKAYGIVKDKMLSLVGNGGKLGDLLDARKNFDAFISKQFPNLYNSDTLTPMRSAIKDIRGAINDVIDSRLPEGKTPDGLNFKDSLKKQSLLYDAIDNTASKVGKIGSNKVTQFIKAHPTAAKIGAAAVGGGIVGGAVKNFTGL